MSKIAVNNEIVLMRQAVRKAKLKVVWKLTKEAKLLKSRKHGDEKVIEKSKRKAEKLIGELGVLKKLKEDDVSKFAITNDTNLQEVLADSGAELKDRVLARMASNDILKKRVQEFKDKFPDYEKYLGPGRKALARIKVKERKKARKLEEKAKIEEETRRAGDGEGEDENKFKDDEEKEANEEDEGGNESEDGEEEEENKSEDEEIESEEEDESKEKKEGKLDEPAEEAKKKKEKIVQKQPPPSLANKLENKTYKKIEKMSKVSTTNPPENKNKRKDIKIVSNLATVKRLKLDEITNEDVEEISGKADDDIKVTEEKIHLEKEEDSFFITGNGQSTYQSIAVPKLKSQNNEDNSEKFSRNNYNNNRNFFNNVENKNDRRGNFPNDRRNNNPGNNKPTFSKRDNTKFDQRKPNNPDKIPKNDKKPEADLHPSWQAKKKQQDILKQGFQGKKIKFDD